ncbi:MAG: hypothetical protein R2882_06260 [Gemmatimonadales bacterium]
MTGVVTEAVITAVRWVAAVRGGAGRDARPDPDRARAFWLETFRRTGGTELRD